MNDFDAVINRRGTSSVKWDSHKDEDLLHLWVADMDFAAPKAIQDALRSRLEHGVLGYTFTANSVSEAVVNWVRNRYDWDIQKQWILFTSGVVPSLSLSVQAYTAPGEKVLVQSPVYAPFFDMVTKNEREVVVNTLIAENKTYAMDFKQLEQQFQEGVKLMFLCSPHNPVGRVWTKEELMRLGELCEAYDVLVVSDDIHADIIFSGHTHTPFASLSESLAKRTITCIAPSKTFNIAGLQAAAVIIQNEELRKRFKDVLHRQGFYTLNLFASTAMEAAYSKCADWLDEMIAYVEENTRFAYEFIQREIPGLIPYRPEGTYLLWVDCSSLNMSKDERMSLIQSQARLIVEPGEKFGPGGEGFIRLNLGSPKSMLEAALHRLKHAVCAQ